jgi:hypothetical protein
MERITVNEKVEILKNALSGVSVGGEITCAGIYDDELCPQPAFQEIDCNG